MKIRESTLRDRLFGDDDEAVYAALIECFEPVPELSPFLHRWQPRPELEVEPEPDELPAGGLAAYRARLGARMMGWVNHAQRSWRLNRFLRNRAEAPQLPVVVCEGDSWVAHPTITDITDHLLDDERYPLLALGVGAAGDVLSAMWNAGDHEQAIAQHGAKALLLSGGGNDLADHFREFLGAWKEGADPRRLLTQAVDDRMLALMVTMRTLLEHLGGRVPVVVHGYDYLQVQQGGRLGRFFDAARIHDADERRAVVVAIVDRYNEHLQGALAGMPGVAYVDLRGTVSEPEEWNDDIHPGGDGFGRLTERIAAVLLERIAGG
jgi:lysophospholipase L1-like esterase